MINQEDEFGKIWSEYQFKSLEERCKYFNSLTRLQQTRIKESFIDNGWCQLFCQNKVDEILDQIKTDYGIDLIDMRIKSMKFGRVFLIERHIWGNIINSFKEYEPLFNSETIFGGITTHYWGKKKQFVVISS